MMLVGQPDGHSHDAGSFERLGSRQRYRVGPGHLLSLSHKARICGMLCTLPTSASYRASSTLKEGGLCRNVCEIPLMIDGMSILPPPT